MTVHRLKFKDNILQYRLNWMWLLWDTICFKLSLMKEASQSCTQSVVELIWEAEGSLQATMHIRVPVVCFTVSVVLLPAVSSTNNSYLYHWPAAGLFSPKLCLWPCLHMCVCVPVCSCLCMSKRLCAIETLINYSVGKSEASWQHLTDDSRGH